MEIRKSTTEDTKQVMAIFETAKVYMIAHGNKTQWGEGYPDEKILKTDIDAGNSYVKESPEHVLNIALNR
ncbi:hypothetical protein [Roseburia sp. AM23-20]|jgi:hypothetical protein|uniref:hypothetical protein n=1 Tax=Roseburia sp. AM23-20 TaxID=2292066 RepID=UPI0018F2EE11|nr:hypothetical protein [Roseburia sp. AM23-20]